MPKMVLLTKTRGWEGKERKEEERLKSQANYLYTNQP